MTKAVSLYVLLFTYLLGRTEYLNYFFIFSPIDTAGLRMSAIVIPRHVKPKETVKLICNFELMGGYLYSVKWYKDEHEFFRYMPRGYPSTQTFPVEGVYVDVSTSTYDLQNSKRRLNCEHFNFDRLI